jgi:hypothetical protein
VWFYFVWFVLFLDPSIVAFLKARAKSEGAATMSQPVPKPAKKKTKTESVKKMETSGGENLMFYNLS